MSRTYGFLLESIPMKIGAGMTFLEVALILPPNILMEFGVGSLHAGGVGVATGRDKTILRSAAKRPLIRAKKDLELT